MTAYSTSHCRSTAQGQQLLLEMLQVLGASLFIGISAQIAIPLPFSPVPLTGQTFAILLVGALMGSRLGVLSILAYITEGCMGFPVWANGVSGFLPLIGPKAGYICGFVVQAYLVGRIVENQKASTCFKLFCCLLLACGIQMGMGILWLASFVGWDNVLPMGLYPFIPGEILKAICVAGYLKRNDAN